MNNYCILFLILSFIIVLIYFIHNKKGDLIFTYDSVIPLSSINLSLLYNTDSSTLNANNNKINLYYINMEKSTERKQRFLTRMQQFNNYNIIRVSAITPQVLHNFDIKSNLLCSLFMKPEEVSCTLSHLKAIELAYNNNDPYALIVEDDLIINKNINWNYFISKLPKDWDIIQLYAFPTPHLNNNTKNIILKKNWLVKTNIVLFSTAIYLISRQGMEKLLSRFVKNTNIKQIMFINHNRHCLADNLIYNNINRYYFTLSFAQPEELDSTISNFALKIRHLL